MRSRLSEIASQAGGSLEGEDREVTGISADSRDAGPGDLFVALPGAHADGSSFLPDAFRAGAAGALARVTSPHGPVVVVDDPGAALLDLARAHRRRLAARVVGITGSVGKTSVKDLTAAALASRLRVVASPRSYNTEIGLPLTLLAAEGDTEAVVCEMGSRGRGHLALLCEVARPGIGVVTNVGPAHLEMFGSLGAVADAKAELIESLPPEGVAVLNADDTVVRGFSHRTSAPSLTYGLAPDADVRGEDLTLDDRGRASFTLREERVELAIPGEHMAHNALAACAVGIAMGLDVGECAAGLKGARLSSWRMETFTTPAGVQVINDAYNANPMSMAAALKAARWISRGSRCIAVLGEMAELGDAGPAEHERVGELAARLGIDALVVVGEGAGRIAAGAAREGLEPGRVTPVPDLGAAADVLAGLVRPGDTVLLKASRRAGFERLAEVLAEGPA